MARLASILLVEDNDVDVLAVRRAFRRHAIVNPLFLAHDGIEALALLAGSDAPPVPRPLLLLVDLNLPRMGGLELLAALRRDAEWRDVPAFVLSTSDDERDQAAAQRLEVVGYLPKGRLAQEMAQVADYLRTLQEPAHLLPRQPAFDATPVLV